MIKDANQLYIDEPHLTWRKPSENRVFSATAELGVVSIELDKSALPSEMNTLELQGSVHAWDENVSVDTEKMIFNNEFKYLYSPGPFQFKSKSPKIAMKGENKAFDILKPSMVELEKLIKSREQRPKPQGEETR
jgi:hypothetical protein